MKLSHLFILISSIALAYECECATERSVMSVNLDLPKTSGRGEGLDVVNWTVLPPHTGHGTVLYDFTIRNHLNRERTVQASVRMRRCMEFQRTVKIGPNGSARLRMPAPLCMERNNNWDSPFVELTSDKQSNPSERIKQSIPLAYGSDWIDTRETAPENLIPQVLLSRAFSAEKFHKFIPTPSRKSGEAEEEWMDILSLKAAPDEWPSDYRSYSTFDAVVMEKPLYDALPAKTKRAIEDYKILGGAVFVVDGVADGLPTSCSEADRKRMRDAILKSNERLSGDLDIAAWGSGSNVHVRRSGLLSENIGFLGLELPSPVPSGLFVLILAAMVLLVMPITARRCAKANRRMMMLVFLPAISVGAAVLFFLIALFDFGTTPFASQRSITRLDQTARHAVTQSAFAIYTPVSVDGQLAFSSEDGVRLRDFRESSHDRYGFLHGGSAHDDEPHSQGFSSGRDFVPHGWVSPLVATFIDSDSAHDRSERLDITEGPDGTLKVVNLLGADVKSGRIGYGGKVYVLGELKAGATTQARSDGRMYAGGDADATYASFFSRRSSYGRNWNAVLEKFGQTTSVGDRAYAVLVDGSPFASSPLGDRKVKGSAESIVVGSF